MILTLTCGLCLIGTGCAARYRVISGDRALRMVKAGESVTVTNDAVVVPMAVWLDLRREMKAALGK